MGHKLLLEVPEEVFDSLTSMARRRGATPEELAVEWLLEFSRQTARDPLDEFIGAIRSSVPDWAEQHDKYLGQALKEQLGGESGSGSDMPELFADTSGWGNLVDPTQPFHSLAATIYRAARKQGRKVVTTTYILAELVALLTSPLRIPWPTTVAFIDGLKTSPYVEVVHVDAVLDDEAWQLHRNRQDKEWSLVDCASFVLMTRRGISEALTTDHHFEQAGFIRLLK